MGHRGSHGAIPVAQDGYAAASAAHMASPLTAISSTGTPAVTPPSSNMSYTSGQSPSPSSSGMSPQSRHSTTSSVMYPNLPAVSSVFPGQSTTSTLGTNFDNNERRNYGGGMLQRANPAPEARRRSDTPTATQIKSESTPTPSLVDVVEALADALDDAVGAGAEAGGELVAEDLLQDGGADADANAAAEGAEEVAAGDDDGAVLGRGVGEEGDEGGRDARAGAE
ncbi:hypothetical protein BN1708_016586, partial [Verticillium longisporum]